jgi:hypothetical protein
MAHAGQDVVMFEAQSGWRDVHRRLQALARNRAALDAEEARLLIRARAAGVHRELGFATFAEYLQRTLAYAPRTARERMRVAERLAELPQVEAALERGEIGYCTVRALTRDAVVDADNEAEWLEEIAAKTVREVEDLMVGRFAGSRPGDRQEPDLMPKRRVMELTPEVDADYQRVKRQLQEQTGEPLDDSAVMAVLCRAFEGAEPGKTRPQSMISISVCARCDAATTDTAGQVIDIEPSALAEARCDVAHVGRDGKVTKDIPDRVRRLVEARDHHRCVVPGCRSAISLHVHHIEERAQGGTHEPRSLCLLCHSHHRLLHRGKLRIVGHAPDLTITHEDGRAYGAPQDTLTAAKATLRELGFTAAEAARAVEHVRTTAPPDDLRDLERVLRACLRACRPG